MEKFFKSEMRIVRGVMGALLWLSLGISTAWAEPEAYNFPPLPRPLAVVNMPPVPSPDTRMIAADAARRREARKKTIVELFRKYNRKLSEKKAEDYVQYILQACEQFNQDPFVIAAMIVNESTVKHDALSRGGDYGLMQVRWRVHRKKIQEKYPHIDGPHDMFDPKYNVLVGTEIFATYYQTAKEDLRGALRYYTAGNKRLIEKVCTVRSQLEENYLRHLKKG
ncbi:MAG: transglycosylase SLT domain-containing protein [Synergistaceae bacterium]|jgi:soluble lytic murein transglycosylase-like protein|nr:transglycosylase SLT domain-containing protein [Synergistaceae bacterium]